MEKLIKKIDAAVSGKSFYLILGVILLIALVFRVTYLDADPPMGITKSQDFSTDPFQYVYFAKNTVDQGTANPYNDPRFSQWEKSSQNLLALIVFNLFGTGRAQGNVVGVIFNLASIWLLALALKNYGSRLGALFFAIIASFDFTLTWFARTPFLEASQNFWLCGSVYLFSRGKDNGLYYAAAGLACAIAAFFGKMIALFMLGSFTLVWLVLYLNDAENRKAVIKSAIRFYAGFAIATLAWLFIIYLPSRGQFAGYLSEQAVGLYGAPKGTGFDQRLHLAVCLADLGARFLRQDAGRDDSRVPVRCRRAQLVCRPEDREEALRRIQSRLGYAVRLVCDRLPGAVPVELSTATVSDHVDVPGDGNGRCGAGLCVRLLAASGSSCCSAKGKSHEHTDKRKPVLFVAVVAIWLLPLVTQILLWIASSGNGSMVMSMRQGILPYALVLLVVAALIALIRWTIKRVSRQVIVYGVAASGLVVLFLIVLNAVKFVTWAGSRHTR